MPFGINEIEFDEAEDSPQVSLISGTLPTTVTAYLKSIDFQEHGVVVVQIEPGSPSGYVRHVTFVPYSNIQKIQQDYTTP